MTYITKKIIATALLISMTTAIFAGCNSENTSSDTAQSSVNTIVSSESSIERSDAVSENTEISTESENSEVSVQENSEKPSSEPTSKSESSSVTSENSKTSEKTETSKSENSTTQTSKPTTSNPAKEESKEPAQTSKPVQNQQTSKPTQNSSTTTQTSKPTQSQTSSPTTVTKPTVKSVTLNKDILSLTVGQTAKLTYTINPSNAQTKLSWHWDNSKVISVAGDGTVTAKAAGTATVTIKTSNGKTDTCKVTVKAKQTSNNNSSPSSKPMTKEEKIAAAYQAPYEGKLTGWQETVIADLREIGETKYHMVWNDGIYIRNEGNDYNCGFNFPTSNFDCWDGKQFREECILQFEELEEDFYKDYQNKLGTEYAWSYVNTPLEGCDFKIVIEDIGYNEHEGTDQFWVYLGYGGSNLL